MSHHFFIWTVRRTGGSSLKRSLEYISDHPVIQAEPFNSDRMLGYDHEEEKLLQRFEEIRGKNYCIKHCWELHKPKYNNMILDYAAQEGYRFILLTRENVLEMLISLELAFQTKVWGRGQIGNISNYEKREFDALNLKRMKRNCEEYNKSLEQCRNRFIQEKFEWIEISHEQLYQGSQESRFNHFNSLCDFLNISQEKINEKSDVLHDELMNKKQNSSKIYSNIPNILEVQQEFSQYQIFIENCDKSSTQDLIKKENTLQGYIEKGNELRKHGNLLDAIEQYQFALTKNPKSVPALRELGSVYEAQGKIDEAIELYQQAIAQDSSRAGLYVKLADALSKQEKFEEAISFYEKATQLKSDLYYQVYTNFGKALEALGRNEQALENHEKAAKMMPQANR